MMTASALSLQNALRHSEHATGDIVASFKPRQLDWLLYDWPIWARTDQLPPANDDISWRTWLMLAGRGAGKTRAGAEWVRHIALKGHTGGPIALIGPTLAQARAVMVEGVSGLLSVHRIDERPVFQASHNKLVWPNGTEAQLMSAEDPDSLRGPQFAYAWCDELAKWRDPQGAWDMLQFALRLGETPRALVTTTPRPIPLIKKLMNDPATFLSKARTADNLEFLAPGFVDIVTGLYGGTRLGRQELDAEVLEDNPDALFQRSRIERSRVSEAPQLTRIVVALDPPATSTRNADACGIICAGLGHDGRAYVLDDATVRRTRPAVWARRAIALYHARSADCLVAEVNQGGEMVTTILNGLDATVAVRPVRAARSKHLRAEPVAALYEQGKVAHVGSHAELEDEMCNFTAYRPAGAPSPDRLDALVWALSDLLLATPQGTPRLRFL